MMQRRKGKLIRIAGFLLLLVILLAALSRLFFIIALKENETGRRTRDSVYADLDSLPDNSIDVLVLGNSEAFSSFSPCQVWNDRGIPCFVGSMYAATMSELYGILRTALLRQHPKVILLETHTLFGVNPGDDSPLKSAGELGKEMFPLFRFHNLWKMAVDRPDPSGRYWLGYRMLTSVRPPKDISQYMKPMEGEETIIPHHRKLLASMKNICDSRGISMLLYSAPSPQNYDMKKHHALVRLSDQLGIPYLDLNLMTNEIGISWRTDSNDAGDHLNVSGAQKTTAYLEQYLLKYGLKDRRKDASYANWKKEAGKYKEEAEKYTDRIRGK